MGYLEENSSAMFPSEPNATAQIRECAFSLFDFVSKGHFVSEATKA